MAIANTVKFANEIIAAQAPQWEAAFKAATDEIIEGMRDPWFYERGPTNIPEPEVFLARIPRAN